EVEPAIRGAVEGPGRGARGAAPRVRSAAGEEDDPGRLVGQTPAAELLAPHRVGNVVDLDEPAVGVLLQGAGAVAALAELLLRLAGGARAGLAAVHRQVQPAGAGRARAASE